ncbi:10583_t:CDS:10 [Funneliformis mosseae]|uniref:10583_t:CDS:1 n=1 Tax=Funneliformis mosseae TaxID=27381 RepID=A0A9N9FIY5_FUNMO|nr:10583_t:CDS:10 [Funneliformis mosseae]
MAARIGIGLEENESLKQQHKVLQEEDRETLCINYELKEELQEKIFNKRSKFVFNLQKILQIPPKIRGALIIQDVLLVLMCPAEYSENARSIMRECLYNAGLIVDKCSSQLQLVTEAEAATIYCLDQLQEHELETGRSTYIDREFIMYLSRKDLEEFAPVIKQYITDENKKHLEAEDWLIELNFNDIKSMFDPVVKNVLQLIHAQLNSSPETCSAMFLVGGFSEPKYLQKRIKQEFQHRVRIILFHSNPTTAIELGAVMYGLSSMNSDSNVIASRIIKYTYGVKTKDDPIHRKVNDGRIDKFDCLAKRGTPMNVNQEITCSYLQLYPTQQNLPWIFPGSGLDNLSFGLAFGQMEVTATTTEIMTGSYVEKFGVGVEKLNNKLTNLLEENKRLKQQHKEFQEENRYILQESEMIEILKKELQEKDEQLKKHQQQDFNFERQKNEMQQLEMMSQNLEKTLKMLEFEELPLCGCDDKSIKSANEPFRKIKKHEKLFSIARPRTLNFTYGIKVRNQWMPSDPINRKTHNGHIIRFASLVRRGTEIIASHTVCALYQLLYHNQTVAEFNIYYTQQDDPKYCDDPDMEFLGQFSIELPILCHHELPKLLLEITFYKENIDVAVRNLMTEKIFKTCFQFCEEDY